MIVKCKFCCESFDVESADRNNTGFWCGYCEGYAYFNAVHEQQRNFYLILESKSQRNSSLLHSTSIKLNKRLSPLRYPGGKSKLADYFLHHINPNKTDLLISPYFGGGSFELALLNAGIVKKLAINDLDFGIYALFHLIKFFPDALKMLIRSHSPDHADFFEARKIIKNNYNNCDLIEAAWALLVVNRLAYSGIYYANPLGGINGSQKDLLSRWNPDNLCDRIDRIHVMADRFTVENEDALDSIEEHYWNDRATLFVDPPYYEQGKNLYLHHYTEDDHHELEFLLDSLYKEFPGTDIIVTYDHAEFIKELFLYPEIKMIDRKFSI